MKIVPFILSLYLPLLWSTRFAAGEVAAALVTVLLISFAKFFGFRLAMNCLLGSFWIQIYLPVARTGGGWALAGLLAGLILMTAWAGYPRDRFDLAKSIRSLYAEPALLLAVAIPLALGCAVALSFRTSPLDLPDVFVPTGGIVGALVFGTLWYWLTRLFVSRAKGFGWGDWSAALAVPILVSLAMVFGNILPTVTKVRAARSAPEESEPVGISEWIALVEKTQVVGLPAFDRYVRENALQASSVQQQPETWVDIAKGCPEDLSEEIGGVGDYWKRLAWGGSVMARGPQLFPENPCVGLEIDSKSKILWTLTAKGHLFRLDEKGDRQFNFDPVQTDYVDCAISPFEPGIYLLENCGRLAHYDDYSLQTISQGTCDPGDRVFRRLKVDPSSGDLWALDLYGNLYHSPSSTGWLRDIRFREVSKRGDLLFDVARDFCISPAGTIALLTCDGEIWKSSKESSEIVGPDRGTHYFPDYPVAQSIDWKQNGYGFVDRYGGFLHAPYPTASTDLFFRGTYLFPRGVFLDEDRVEEGDYVVDHEYHEEKRRLYQLTAAGRLFTNYKGAGTQAD